MAHISRFTGRTHARCVAAIALVAGLAIPEIVSAQIKATARPGATPAWTKGITAITPESYYNAMECGRQGGDDPPCVFWDTGVCKNDDFALAFFTPYKMVAHQVWSAVQRKQAPPQPSYPAAQRTRVTIGVSPVHGSKNVFTALVLKRGGKVVSPVARAAATSGGRFTYDYPAFAPTATLTVEMVGKTKTVSCTAAPAALKSFR